MKVKAHKKLNRALGIQSSPQISSIIDKICLVGAMYYVWGQNLFLSFIRLSLQKEDKKTYAF